MSVRPVEQAEKVTFDFRIVVSSEFVEEQIDADGVRPPADWDISFDLGEIPPPLRRRLRLAHQRYIAVEPYPEFPSPIGDPEQFLEALEPWLDEVEAEEAKEERAQQEMERAAAAAQQRFKEDMESWAAENGSTRLRAALERGYRANTTYAVERGANEFPGFWVDTAGDCEWGERTDPSEEALRLEAEIEAHMTDRGLELPHRIVWLEESPRALDRVLEEEDESFEPEEAILVPDYLGRYSLVLPVSDGLRNATGAA